jgi:hypothetical protein
MCSYVSCGNGLILIFRYFDMKKIIHLNIIVIGVSVSIVSDYRLDDRDSIPGRGKGFFV